jgi:hypothetical protein
LLGEIVFSLIASFVVSLSCEIEFSFTALLTSSRMGLKDMLSIC